ncbi:hypothetical protein PMW74_23435, partial [Citrobacter farmeri]|nr:hypothetical protein [Citrobacter farmeri]
PCVRITCRCRLSRSYSLTVMPSSAVAVSEEVQELRKELYQVKQVVKGMRNGMFSVLNER